MKKFISLFLLLSVLLSTSFTHRPLLWVAIGDSITYLNEHPDETGNRVTRGYLSRTTDKLSYIKYVNQGHNGWTSGNIAHSIEKLGIPVADVYTIFLGTNDWWHGTHIGSWQDYSNSSGDTTVYGSFRIIVEKIRSLNKDAAIILITPMQRGDFVYLANAKNNAYGSYRAKEGQTLEQFADAILDIGRHEQLKVLDLYHYRKLGSSRAVHFKRLRIPDATRTASDSSSALAPAAPSDKSSTASDLSAPYQNYPWPSYINIPFNPLTDEYPYPPDAIDVTYDGLHPSDKGNTLIARKLTKILKKL